MRCQMQASAETFLMVPLHHPTFLVLRACPGHLCEMKLYLAEERRRRRVDYT